MRLAHERNYIRKHVGTERLLAFKVRCQAGPCLRELLELAGERRWRAYDQPAAMVGVFSALAWRETHTVRTASIKVRFPSEALA